MRPRNRLAGGVCAPLPAAESFLEIRGRATACNADVWCDVGWSPGAQPRGPGHSVITIGGSGLAFVNVPSERAFSFEGTLDALEGLAAAMLAACAELRRHGVPDLEVTP